MLNDARTAAHFTFCLMHYFAFYIFILYLMVMTETEPTFKQPTYVIVVFEERNQTPEGCFFVFWKRILPSKLSRA